MPYLILSSVSNKDDGSDVMPVMNTDGTTMIFTNSTEAKEYAEENLNFWYQVVRV